MDTVLESGRFGPRTGALASASVHALIILSALIAWRHTFHPAAASTPVVPVDLVTIGDQTDIAPMTREESSDPQSDLASAPAPPSAPAEVAPAFEMKLFPAKPQPPQTPVQTSQLRTAAGDSTRPAASGPPQAQVGDHDIAGQGKQTGMMMSLLDDLRNQIARCWIPPRGTERQDRKVVTFELSLNMDGSVARPPVLMASPGDAADHDFALQAEAVRRAIYTCAPYRLPPDRFSVWQHAAVRFDVGALSR